MDENKILWGTGKRVITPEKPAYLAGYFNRRLSETVLDDLEARVLILSDGERYFGIIQFDLLTVSELLALQTYKRLKHLKVFSEKNLLITATHTHTAPEVRSSKPGFDLEYLETAAEAGVEALSDALENIQAGYVKTAKASDGRFSFNRRYWMKDGTVLTNPGKMNTDVLKPEGGTDFDIPVMAIEKEGMIKVILANIVNHTDTIGGNGISADWPGFTIRAIQKRLSADLMVIPFIGCSGNINHFDISIPEKQSSYREAERIGSGYAESILSVIPSLQKSVLGKFRIVYKEISVQPREISQEELEEAEKILAEYADADLAVKGDLTSEDLVKKTPVVMRSFAERIKEMAGDKNAKTFRLTGLFMDDLCIISLPCEPFVEIGLELKNKIFPKKLTMVVSHSNGTGGISVAGGYIPNEWNYGKGGYETNSRSNPFAKNTSGILIRAWNEIRDLNYE